VFWSSGGSRANVGSVSELTHQDALDHESAPDHEAALRHAAELISEEISRVETRCRVLAQFTSDCDTAGTHTAAWADGLRELRALHDYRAALLRRLGFIEQALDTVVGETPALTELGSQPDPSTRRARQQIQVQVRRRRS
jgi:hypothetical protein